MKTKAVIENGLKVTETGLIPEDWETTTLENEKLFEFTNGLWKGKKAPFAAAKVIRNTNFNNDGTLSLDDVAELDVEEKQFIKRQLSGGDIILERSGGGPKQPVGRVVFFDLKEGNYSFSNFTTRIRIEDINTMQPKYILYYLLHFYNRGCTYELQQRTTGIRNLNFTDYKKIQIPLLFLPEQHKIVHVLSKIQQATEQQNRIIKTTRELKKSLMNKLFTEGLHGEEQKETEIGLMPKSWDAIYVQDCCEVVTGGTPRTEVREYYKEGSIRWMKSGDINTKPIYEVKNRITQLGLENSNARLMPEGTVVIALSGRGKTRGTTSILMVDCACSQSVAGMVPNPEKIDSFYLHYYMAYNYDKVRNITGDKDRSGLNLGLIRQIKITKPKSTVEQKEIADAILSIDKKIWQAESKKQTLQALFRTMLNQLMTGKVRVRDLYIEVN